jgi:uncharacterized protein YqeY
MLRDRFTSDLKEAMKAGDKPRLGTIRLIQAALKDKDIEARGCRQGADLRRRDPAAPPEDGEAAPGERQACTCDGGRPGARRPGECRDRRHLRSILPKQMDDAEAKAAIAAVIAETGAAGVKDMGKVMGELKARYAGQMDFGKASPLVKQLLG